MATSSSKTITSVKPKTSQKAVSTKTPAAKSAPAAEPKEVSAPKVVSASTANTAVMEKSKELKKKELIERIIAKNGMKRRDVKPVVETMLEVLGAAIGDGETLNLQPFGKVMVKRTNDAPNAKVSVVKIRQRKETP